MTKRIIITLATCRRAPPPPRGGRKIEQTQQCAVYIIADKDLRNANHYTLLYVESCSSGYTRRSARYKANGKMFLIKYHIHVHAFS